jgi:polyisoprenoid-binding protein YceI
MSWTSRTTSAPGTDHLIEETRMSDTSSLTRTIDGAPFPAAGTYAIDKAHTTIGFVARHLVVTKVRGQFNEFEGTVVVGDTPASSSVNVTIDVASIDTREPQRDAHLKSADFFEHEAHPQITFVSTGIAADGGDWKVTGDLTIRGVTKPVTLDVEFNGATPDPWGGTRLGFSAEAEINRNDYGVSFNAALETGGLVVGDKVKLEIEAELILQA